MEALILLGGIMRGHLADVQDFLYKLVQKFMREGC